MSKCAQMGYVLAVNVLTFLHTEENLEKIYEDQEHNLLHLYSKHPRQNNYKQILKRVD